MEKVLLGPGNISCDDLVCVCAHTKAAVLDPAAVEKLAAAAASIKAPTSAASSAAADSSPASGKLSPLQSRACVCAVAIQALEGRAGFRPQTVQALISAVNAGTVEAVLPTPASVAAEVARIAAAAGSELSPVEGHALTHLLAPAAGVAAVAGIGAHAALLLADTAAALTLEALQAPAEALDTAHVDTVRNIPGVTASAGNIRLLVEGSREIGKAVAAGADAKGKGAAEVKADPTSAALAGFAKQEAVIAAAQTNGAAYGVIIPLMRVLTIELNSAPSAAVHTGSATAPVAYHAQPLSTALASLASGVATLSAASAARSDVLRAAAAAAGVRADLVPSEDAVAASRRASEGAVSASVARAASDSVASALTSSAALQRAVDALYVQLADEIALAEALLAARETVAAAAAAAKEARRVAAAAARAEADAKRLAAMTPEERAKAEEAEAKRREKEARKEAAEAAAAAAAGVAVAAGVPNLLNLGPGAAAVRGVLRNYGASAPGASDASDAKTVFASVLRALSPYADNVLASQAVSDAVRSVVSLDSRAAGAPAQRLDTFVRALLDRIGSGGTRRRTKIPKGTRDYRPEQMEVREKCFDIIRKVFKRHGACEIDTPVFELRETLMGKYGEEGGKLVYDLADQGGELLSLRYDLTVPFARYVAMNNIDNLKRYHIARVYRRDNPAMNRGRYREFYQCDYDVAGNYAPMMADAEVIAVGVEILSSLPIGEFTLKLNHRKLLDAVLDICGVPASKFRPICSAIDKLDKEPWSAVREEMITEKGLTADVADRIGTMVQLSGKPMELLTRLRAAKTFGDHAGAAAALTDLETLFKYLTAFGAVDRVTFDLSLARGLDYYTGVIYEAVLLDPSIGVGSIAAGGRYDNLVGMFAAPGTVVPCVGISIGVERVFTIMEAKAHAAEGGLRRTPVSVMVASIPSKRVDMNVERMRVCADLWRAGISAEFVYANDPKLQKQMSDADQHAIPIAVILGEDELERGEVQVKNLQAREQQNVPRAELVATVRRLLSGGPAGAAVPASTGAAGAAAAAPSAAGASSAAGSVGTTLEGGDRTCGHFTRPAAAIL